MIEFERYNIIHPIGNIQTSFDQQLQIYILTSFRRNMSRVQTSWNDCRRFKKFREKRQLLILKCVSYSDAVRPLHSSNNYNEKCPRVDLQPLMISGMCQSFGSVRNARVDQWGTSLEIGGVCRPSTLPDVVEHSCAQTIRSPELEDYSPIILAANEVKYCS